MSENSIGLKTQVLEGLLEVTLGQRYDAIFQRRNAVLHRFRPGQQLERFQAHRVFGHHGARLTCLGAKCALREFSQVLPPKHPAMPRSFDCMEFMPYAASRQHIVNALCSLEQVVQRPAADHGVQIEQAIVAGVTEHGARKLLPPCRFLADGIDQPVEVAVGEP